MTQTTKPTKQAVREWLERRIAEDNEPPSIEEIRRQLGWDLIPQRAPKATND